MNLASGFDILPAIDLRGGRVVRLEQGDFDRETAFSNDPLAVAESFAAQGARWLHVVDLDGARTGEPAHGAVVRSITEAVGNRVAVEVAGGLRSQASVSTVLDAGAARAVVGTAALEDPALLATLVHTFGADRIAVALDVRDGRAIGHGWTADAPGRAVETALAGLASRGATTFEVTAIERDGLLGGPDLDLYRRLVGMELGSIIASAGIVSTSDIAAVRALGCTGAIIGRALYDGRLDLSSALATGD
jgi:phosphoribosylformimino-5-aminoimidazole carboxamide ribotide isomerase